MCHTDFQQLTFAQIMKVLVLAWICLVSGALKSICFCRGDGFFPIKQKLNLEDVD